MGDSYYLTAEVCGNGHYTTNRVEHSPELRSPHCPTCGLATFTRCPHCDANIRGEYYVPGVLVLSGASWAPQNYCYNCGSPFPWTQQKVEAAQELVRELELNEEDKKSLELSIPDLTSDNPRTELAASRYGRIRAKLSGVAGAALDKSIEALATAAVKQLLGL